MRIILSLLFSFLTLFSVAQNRKDTLPDLNIEKLQSRIDSINKATDSLMKASIYRMDSAARQRSFEQNQRNLDQFMAERRAAEKKKEKSLWIRGGILLLAVGLGIFGYVRRRRAKKNNV